MASNNTVSIVIRAFDQTKGGLTMPIKNMEDMATAAKKLAPVMAAAGTAIAGAFAVMARSQINAADETSKLAKKLGTTTEYLSTLEHAANISGSSIDGLRLGFKTLSAQTLQAAQGSKESLDAFRALGVEFRNADGTLRGSESLIGDISDRFAAMPDGTEKAALAVKLFGKSGLELIPMLNEGSRGMAALQDEARALGLEINSGAARQAEEFNDTLTRLKSLFMGVVNQVVQQVLPTLVSLAQQVLEAGKQGGVFAAVGQTIIDIFIGLVRFGGAVKDTFDLIGRGLGTLAAGWVEFFRGNVEEARAIFHDFTEGLKRDWNDLANNFTKPDVTPNFTMPGVSGGNVESFTPLIGDATAEKAQAEAQKMVDAVMAEYERLGRGKMELLALEERDRTVAAIRQISDANKLGVALSQIAAIYAQKRLELREEEAAAQRDIVEKQAEEAAAREEAQLEQERNTLIAIAEMREQFRLDHLVGVEREIEAERQRLTAQLESINALQIAEEDARALREEAESAHYERLTQIRNRAEQQAVIQASAVQQARMQAMASLFGSMAQLAATFGKKNSVAYKAFASAQALISAYLAAANVMAQPHLIYPLNLVAAGVTLAQGLAQVASINAAPTGAAHGGLSYVPSETTYLLDRGERVVSPKQNEDLTDFLAGERGGSSGPTMIEILLDGEILGRGIGRMSRDGRLTIHAGAVA